MRCIQGFSQAGGYQGRPSSQQPRFGLGAPRGDCLPFHGSWQRSFLSQSRTSPTCAVFPADSIGGQRTPYTDTVALYVDALRFLLSNTALSRNENRHFFFITKMNIFFIKNEVCSYSHLIPLKSMKMTIRLRFDDPRVAASCGVIPSWAVLWHKGTFPTQGNLPGHLAPKLS